MEMKSTATTEKPNSKLRRLETKLTSLNTDLQNQEAIYKTAYDDLLSALETFNKEVAEEYKKLEVRELERVNTLKQSLQGFARTLSNTAPAYLESMQQIVLSVDEIDGSSDIKCFVETHSDLMTPPLPPNFEKYTVGVGQESFDNAAAAVSNKSDYSDHEENSTEHPEAAKESGGETSTDVDSEMEQNSTDSKSESLDEDSQLPQPGSAIGSTTTQEQKRDSGTQLLVEKQPKQPRKLPGSTAKARPNETVIGTPSLVASVVKGMETKSQECAEKVNAKQKKTAQSISSVRPQLAPKPRLNITGDSKVKRSSPPPAESKQATKGTAVGFISAASAVASQQNPPRTRTSSMESRDSKEIKERTATLNSVSSQFRPKGHSFHGSASNARVQSSPQSKKRTSTNADAEKWTRNDKEELSDGTSPEAFQMLCQLQQQATANDYYTLLGVEPGASTDEMARARREKSKDLHPDHFGSDPDKRASAEEQLVLINQIFQDVFKNEETRSLYDQLCNFRKVYPKTLQQKQKGLETAEGKLLGLYKKMKKAQMPLPLLDELQSALGLIKVCLQKLQS